jgi:excisionase family DNA binding protein
MDEEAAKTPREAADQLGITTSTLRKWAKNGAITFNTTAGGHRRYDVSSVQVSRRVYNLPLAIKKTKEPVVAKGGIYCRVSSWKQKEDLQRQIGTLQNQFPDHTVFSDICSGLKYKRPGLTRLLEHVQGGLVNEVVVAHKDRLARFGTELIEWILKRAGARLVVLDQATLSPTEEVTQDLMAIVHVFSCRLNGKRRYQGPQSSGTKRKIGGLQRAGCGPTEAAQASVRRRSGSECTTDALCGDEAPATAAPSTPSLDQGRPMDVELCAPSSVEEKVAQIDLYHTNQ